VFGIVLRTALWGRPTRDELEPEDGAGDAGVDGGARLRSVRRVQAPATVPAL